MDIGRSRSCISETGDLPSPSLNWVHLVLMLLFSYLPVLCFSLILCTMLCIVSMVRFSSLIPSNMVVFSPMLLFELNKIYKNLDPQVRWLHFKFSLATCSSGYILDGAE